MSKKRGELAADKACTLGEGQGHLGESSYFRLPKMRTHLRDYDGRSPTSTSVSGCCRGDLPFAGLGEMLHFGLRKGGIWGRRSTHILEQIIGKLREVEVLLSHRIAIGEASRKVGATAHRYYRWRREYGGRRGDQAKSLRELEKENSRLK
jgi:putative transposase